MSEEKMREEMTSDRWDKKTRLAGLFVTAWLLDRVTKQWALSALETSTEHTFFSLALYFNSGVSFSLLRGHEGWSFFVATVGLALLILVCFRCKELHKTSGMTLLLAGSAANLTDRLLYGYVIDWIYIVRGYINLADVWLCVGTLQIFAWCFKNFHEETEA